MRQEQQNGAKGGAAGMGFSGRLVWTIVALCLWAGSAIAQTPTVLARLAGTPEIALDGRAVVLTLPLSQGVPWRTRLMNDPARIVIDFGRLESDPSAFTSLTVPASVAALRFGEAGAGWSRLIVELTRLMLVESAEMALDEASGRARLQIRLMPARDDDFAARIAAQPQSPTRADPFAATPAAHGPLVVVLDPGHGGVDPGAVVGNLTESALMLTFAREMAEALRRQDGVIVALTREADEFVSLEARIRLAREAITAGGGRGVFLSLHADAVPEGIATGATIYTLATEASDAAAAALAERHDRDDLLGGVQLVDGDDTLAMVLLDIARRQTQPRNDALALSLVGAIQGSGGRMHRNPWQQAAFSVLKSADIPSVLIEVGFMSSPRDLANLQDPRWRARMIEALVTGLLDWDQRDRMGQ